MEENKPKNIQVDTYAADMAGVIDGSEAGLVKKIIKEQSLYEESQKAISPQAVKNKIYLYVGIFFTLLSIATITYLVMIEDKLGVANVAPQFVPIIFTDNTAFVEVAGKSKPEILKDVSLSINEGELKEGTVKAVYLSEGGKVIGLPRFLELIEAAVPKERMPLFSESFLMGVTQKRTKDFFILLGVKEFSEAFNEMRVWEEKMYYDIHKFFGLELTNANKYILEKNFEDGIVENKNARILYDNEGNILIMYVFIDNDHIVVANTEEAVREVMLRLSASKVKK